MRADARTLAAYAAHAGAFVDDWLAQPPPIELQDTATRLFRPGAVGGLTADIGCGSGREVDWLDRQGFPCVGFDASPALLAEARARFPDGRFERGTLPLLSEIAPRTFDNVVCETVLMHLPRDAIAAAVGNLRRILVHDGVLYLSWRVSAFDQRDERDRLYSAFDASLVREALDGMTIEHDAEAAGAPSGKRIQVLVARARGNAVTRKPRGERAG